jgi:hypothetical protein
MLTHGQANTAMIQLLDRAREVPVTQVDPELARYLSAGLVVRGGWVRRFNSGVQSNPR